LKILLVTDAFLPNLGGVERHVNSLSNYLAESGFEVTILTEIIDWDDTTLEKKGIKILREMDLKRRDADYKWPYTRVVNSRKITKNINDYGNEFDLVHYHGTHSLFMDQLNLETPVVNTIHGIFPVCIANWGIEQWCGKNPSMIDCSICTAKIKTKYIPLFPAMMLFSGYYYNRMKSSLKSVDKVVSVSNYVGNIVKRGLGLENLVNIYNFIDIKNDIEYNLKQSKKQDIFNLGTGNKIILFSGRIVKSKGIHILLESFEEVQKEINDAHLVITGSGELKSLVEDSSSQNANVSYLGYIPREEQLVILNKSSVFAAPSTYPDACPTSILESMALGVPVISTNIGGIPELVAEGETGNLVEPNDSHMLAKKLIEILSEDTNKYHDKCVERAIKFDISTIGPQISNLYKELTS
jgi:glycosyltransferase involved in cell wall biosynthesis